MSSGGTERVPAGAGTMRRYMRQLGSESAVYGISSAVSKLAFVILVPLFTRIFSPAEYGLATLTTTLVMLVGSLVVLALDNSAHRWFWDSEDEGDRRTTIASWAWCQLVVSLAAMALLAAGAEWIARVVVRNAAVAPYLRIASGVFPLMTFSVVATNWFRMQRRPWAALLFNVGFVIVTVALTLLFVVMLDQGVAGVFRAQIATYALASAFALPMLGRWVDPRYVNVQRLREMLRYALPLIPAALSFWVVNAADRLFVERYASTADVGVYQVGYALASLVALGTQAFQQAWGPFAMSIHRQADAPSVYAHVLLVYTWGACLASAAVGMFAPELVRLVATSAYSGAQWVAALLAFGYAIVGLTYIAGLGCNIARQTRPIGVAITAAALLNIALNAVLTPRFGKEGAAAATLLSQATIPLFLFWRSQLAFPIPFRFTAAAAVVVFAVTVTAAGLLLPITGAAAIVVKLLLLGSFLLLLPALGLWRVRRFIMPRVSQG